MIEYRGAERNGISGEQACMFPRTTTGIRRRAGRRRQARWTRRELVTEDLQRRRQSTAGSLTLTMKCLRSVRRWCRDIDQLMKAQTKPNAKYLQVIGTFFVSRSPKKKHFDEPGYCTAYSEFKLA